MEEAIDRAYRTSRLRIEEEEKVYGRKKRCFKIPANRPSVELLAERVRKNLNLRTGEKLTKEDLKVIKADGADTRKPTKRVTEEMAVKVVKMLRAGATQNSICEAVGLSLFSVRSVKNNKKWRYLWDM